MDASRKSIEELGLFFTSFLDTNSTLTIIDQLSFVIAPLIVTFMLSYLGYFLTALGIIAWNILAWAGSRILLVSIYEEIPELSKKAIKEVQNSKKQEKEGFFQLFKTYAKQDVAAAAFGLALLYYTVLSFDGVSCSLFFG